MQAVEELSPEKLQEYKDIFSFFDRDGGGSIGAEEFDQVCHWMSDLILNIKCTFRS
jgi:Ca2+-binding EF-hand superfamily protein